MDSPKPEVSQTPAPTAPTPAVPTAHAVPTVPTVLPASASVSTAKAEQLKDQLYNPDAKLTDLFGELEPKLMLDAIKKTYNPKAMAL